MDCGRVGGLGLVPPAEPAVTDRHTTDNMRFQLPVDRGSDSEAESEGGFTWCAQAASAPPAAAVGSRSEEEEEEEGKGLVEAASSGWNGSLKAELTSLPRRDSVIRPAAAAAAAAARAPARAAAFPGRPAATGSVWDRFD